MSQVAEKTKRIKVILTFETEMDVEDTGDPRAMANLGLDHTMKLIDHKQLMPQVDIYEMVDREEAKKQFIEDMLTEMAPHLPSM